MIRPTTWLPQLYQRFQPFWDRVTPAAGPALLLWASAEATGAFPSEWRLFLAAILFLLGMASPEAAYVAFTFLISYPLYRISIYMAALLLAVLILTSPWAMRNLGAAVLILITPALLPWRLETAVPLVAGLWWGELTGALAGGLAALWLKLLAGMAGQPLDLTRLSGWTPAGTNIVARFNPLNSLNTLLELVNPFADTSQALLLHLLQILAWALAGYLAGLLVRRTWSDHWRGWAPLLSAIPAGGVLWASYGLLPPLINQTEIDLPTWLNDLAPWLLASALTAAAARQFYLYLRRPLVRPLRRPSARRREPPSHPAPRKGRLPKPSPPQPKQPPFEWTRPQRPPSTAEADDDIIMLEID
jgi:hypothetical protein